MSRNGMSIDVIKSRCLCNAAQNCFQDPVTVRRIYLCRSFVDPMCSRNNAGDLSLTTENRCFGA